MDYDDTSDELDTLTSLTIQSKDKDISHAMQYSPQNLKCLYAIRDECDEVVCTVSLRSCPRVVFGFADAANVLLPRPGDALYLCLDFQGDKEGRGYSRCKSVKAQLEMLELRPDGSQIQVLTCILPYRMSIFQEL